MAVEKCLDAGQCPAGRGDGELLAGDLEQQGTVQIHRRQLRHPRPGVEGRPVVDEPRQHGVGAAKVGASLPQPLGAAGIFGHGAPLPSPGDCMRATIFMPESDKSLAAVSLTLAPSLELRHAVAPLWSVCGCRANRHGAGPGLDCCCRCRDVCAAGAIRRTQAVHRLSGRQLADPSHQVGVDARQEWDSADRAKRPSITTVNDGQTILTPARIWVSERISGLASLLAQARTSRLGGMSASGTVVTPSGSAWASGVTCSGGSVSRSPGSWKASSWPPRTSSTTTRTTWTWAAGWCGCGPPAGRTPRATR